MSITNMAVLTGLQFPLTGAITRLITGGKERRLTDAEMVSAAFWGGVISGVACAPMELVMIQQQVGNNTSSPHHTRDLVVTFWLRLRALLLLTELKSFLVVLLPPLEEKDCLQQATLVWRHLLLASCLKSINLRTLQREFVEPLALD